MLIRLKNLFLDLLFPAHCVACGTQGSFLCKPCASSLPPMPPVCIGCGMMTPENQTHLAGHTCDRCKKKTSIRVFLSPFAYRHQIIRRIIHEFKYRRITSLSSRIADLLVSYLRHYRIPLSESMLIMPIPLHPRKERVRGFNQAAYIAQDISERISLPIDMQTLVRITPNIPQTSLHAQERQKNVQNIFSLRDKEKVRGKIIILVDDVKTTGATLEQAARVAKQAGAKEIWAITFAH